MSSRYIPFIPEYAQKALEQWYLSTINDETCEAFVGTWGGFSSEHFLHALRQGVGEDRLCAMFALGASPSPEDAEVLLPFLHSERREERCVSAIALGMRSDVRAYPFLEALLLEGLSREERQITLAGEDQEALMGLFLCDRFRPRAVQLFAAWPSPTVVPTLLHVLQDLWAWETVSSQRFGERATYQELLYTLGQRGIWDALETVDFPPAYQRIARVYLTLGALHVQPAPTLMRRVLGQTEHMLQALEERFRLTEEEANWHITTFYQENEVLLAYRHGWDEQGIEEGLTRRFQEQMSETLSVSQFMSGVRELETEEEAEEKAQVEEKSVRPTEPTRQCFNRGQTATIWSLSWSPDSTHLASGSEDHTVQIWNGQTGKQVRLFRGHAASVMAVNWSPDGQWIASAGGENQVLVWNAWSGERATVYTGHSGWIWNGLAWSPDGRYLASASWDGSVQIWEALTGTLRLSYREHHGIVTSVAWSPDGTRVVSGGGYPECAVHVWDALTGQQQVLYRAHMQDTEGSRSILAASDPAWAAWQRGSGSVRSLSWSPDGQWIASAGQRNIFRVWNACTGENLIAQAQNHTSGPLAWSPDSAYVAESQHNGIAFWQMATKRITHFSKPVSQYPVIALAWSPDGKAIATGVANPRIGVWNVFLR